MAVFSQTLHIVFFVLFLFLEIYLFDHYMYVLKANGRKVSLDNLICLFLFLVYCSALSFLARISIIAYQGILAFTGRPFDLVTDLI